MVQVFWTNQKSIIFPGGLAIPALSLKTKSFELGKCEADVMT